MTEAERTALEERLAKLTDAELRAEWLGCDVEGEACDLISGECERRHIEF